MQDFATIHGIFRYKNHADIRDVLEAQRCSAADGQIGLPDEAGIFRTGSAEAVADEKLI